MSDESEHWYKYPNRTLCACLEEMRSAVKCLESSGTTRHVSSLIEEIQTYANRMEGALEDKADIRSAHDRKGKLKRDIKKIEGELEQLKNTKSESE